MDNTNAFCNEYGFVSLTEVEMSRIIGGSDGLDHEIAKAIGKGIGFSLKKLVKLLEFLSDNLNEMQKNAYLLYQ